MQRSPAAEFHDGKGVDPAAGKAAHGGRPRRKDRAEHPSGSADSDGSRYRGGCGGGFGELYGADHHH